ncbi:MAG: glycosyltransferase family 39 protein [Chloroflexi bacterium]|nr:glycosyltransferase family 39 protein [Chloroflexota bacterium]
MPSPTLSFRLPWRDLAICGAIVLLAACLRLYALDALPPGLHYDEAFNATMARNVQLGIERPIFFREDLTEEPMAIYLTALSFAIFGPSPWALRLVSALAGIAGVAALYFLARAFFASRWFAALATLILAILYWHINFSRLGMEPIFTPLMATLAFGFLWRGIYPHPNPLPSAKIADRKESKFPPLQSGAQAGLGWGLAGIFLAATLYTYKAGLFVPILAAAFLVSQISYASDFLERHWRGILIFGVVAILVYAPLGLYFVAHPDEFWQRPQSVAATASIYENAVKVAGMFFIAGDDNPRSNLPGRPALDPFLALGFIVGVIVALARFRREPHARLLVLWLIVMSLPSVLTDFAPHFGRDLAVTPAIALTTAYGFAWLFDRSKRIHLPITIYALLLTLGLAFSTFNTARDYFIVWGSRTGHYDSFDVGLYTLAQKLREQPRDTRVYLTPTEAEHYTARFALDGRDAELFDGRRVLVLPPAGTPVAYGIITRQDTRTRARLNALLANTRVVETIYDYTAQPYAIILRGDSPSSIAPQKKVNARLGDAVELIGYDLARNGDQLALTLYWRSRVETRTDWTVFVQLIGQINPGAGSPVWAQDDSQPGRDTFPTSRWRTGEIIIDEYRLTLAALPRGDYYIEIGMYDLNTGARLPVLDANGARMESESVQLERLSLP